MNKCFVALLLILGLTSCTQKDEHYYQMHPQELQQAVRACPDKQPRDLTCAQLDVIARHMNTLGYQLQQSPQGFGTMILALQETIAKQQQQLKAQENRNSLNQNLAENKKTLAQYLAVVKWLESPVS